MSTCSKSKFSKTRGFQFRVELYVLLYIQTLRWNTIPLQQITLDVDAWFIPPPWYKEGWMDPPPPPRVFDILQYYETILPSVKSLSFPALKNVVYFMGGGAVGVFDVFNNVHHLGCHLRFCQELEIRLKPQEMEIFFYMKEYMKNNTGFSHKIYFYCLKNAAEKWMVRCTGVGGLISLQNGKPETLKTLESFS